MKHRSALFPFLALLFCCIRAPQSPAAAQAGLSVNQAASGDSEPLVLPQVLARVFASNPELRVSELEIQAASARILQAGLKPNPELAVGAEDFAAMGGTGMFGYMESTFQISQRFELGGKRAARVNAEVKGKAAAGRMLELKKAELIAAASQAFTEVLASQQRLANQQRMRQLAQQAHVIVIERVAAGKVSPVEQTRATVALASAELEEEKQVRALIAAKDRLAAMWGGSHRDIGNVKGRFEIQPIPTGQAESCLENAPELHIADAAIDFRRSILEFEQASRKPDLTIGAGFRRLNLERVDAWVASASIPLPFFDKRQGAIAEARVRIEKSLMEKKAVEWRLRSSLTQARHDHETALMEARTLTQTALPAASEALAAVEEGYRFGKFDFLNVLDAQRTYAELQRRYIEAVASGLKAAIEIERLARCASQADPGAGKTKETSREK